jgi:MEDS: MEthanogen/methylotroph, DcmR Sensory domain
MEQALMCDAPVRLAGSELGTHPHICAFFHDEQEEARVLLPFIKEGLECGDKAMHVVDPVVCRQHVQHLESQGLAIAQAEQRGQFEVHGWDEFYLAGGSFDQDRMLATIEQVLIGARRDGFRRTRTVCHMEWALEEHPGVDQVIEYESRANLMWARVSDPVICVYDLRRFSGGVVMGVLRAHPMILIGHTVQENPFYVPPEEYLEELRSRRYGRIGRGDQAAPELH